MELLIRAGRDDHLVVGELCAPAAAGLRLAQSLPLNAVVTDAPVAVARPALREHVEAAGVPFLVDPMTFLLQDEQAADGAWARLPFADPTRLTPRHFGDDAIEALVENVLGFERDQGATVLVPPYVYLARPGDGWLDVQLRLLDATARYVERHRIDLPVAPVFAASLHRFGRPGTWSTGLDLVLRRAADMNARFVGLSLTWSPREGDSYDQLATLLTATRHAVGTVPVVGWRQGLYGAAMTVMGAAGYETGPGHSERGRYPAMMRSRRPRPADDEHEGGGGGAFVYLSAFGRSIPRRAAEVLLDDDRIRGSLVCADDACCPAGASSMTMAWRQHAVRARAAQLRALRDMPNQAAWRLNKIARDAERAQTVARLANDVLSRAERPVVIPAGSFANLAAVADAIRSDISHVA